MAEHRPPSTENPGAAAIGLLGERWNYLIAREIFFGTRRFGQLQRALGIAPNILSGRLNALVDAGMIVKHRYRTEPDWYEYHLAEHAHEVVPALLAVAQWAETHRDDQSTIRALRHTVCGELTTPVVTCNCCGEPLRARDLQPEVVERTVRAKRATPATARDSTLAQ
ncbi:helix-turn-helix domain-containing protein [Arthrobacter sp. SLBN-53]|uniref:winged helix-turn-helix transcriptional regulator n=1 Tax=Arthrobacter sp. SLBN-53 TaxID=2768412 RepID=UPI00114F56B0|nr:helix-turn-helix domain-containing protein [Arthrobacter sp. SLBN-53]TQK29880.1 HxlR family transcriptional regulator [Arthrobacter sp. SLBN-53]